MKLSTMPASFLSAITLSALLLQLSTATTNILIVGDSIGAYMGEAFLEGVCIGSNVCNAAISGTTAAEWAKYDSKKVKECSAKWDVVYISVGGNDSLNSGCSISSTKLAKNIQAAVTNIMTNIAPGASKYLLTGYCVPFDSPNSGCAEPSDTEVMSEALALIDTAESYVEVIDSFSACGGSSSSFSNKKYFFDAIHLNGNGYCKIFTQQAVQTSLACSAITKMDCDTLEILPNVDNDTTSVVDNSGDPVIPSQFETSPECIQRCAAQVDLTNNASCEFAEMDSCACVSPDDPYCFLECDSSGTMRMACAGMGVPSTSTDTNDKDSEVKAQSSGALRGIAIFSSHLTLFAYSVAKVVIWDTLL